MLPIHCFGVKTKYLSQSACACWLCLPFQPHHATLHPLFQSFIYTVLARHSQLCMCTGGPLSRMLTPHAFAWLTPTHLSNHSMRNPSSEASPESQTSSNSPFIQSYNTWYPFLSIHLGCNVTFTPVFSDGKSILFTTSPAACHVPIP